VQLGVNASKSAVLYEDNLLKDSMIDHLEGAHMYKTLNINENKN
jgi:hypothetical protein